MEKREIDWNEYLDAIALKSDNLQQQDTKLNDEDLKKLCEIALETRKFEIDLYWRRTTYYWAFIAADLAAYALVYSKKEAFTAVPYGLMGILAALGVLFSVGWFLANRGSKYWQENWECHIGLLVRRKYGPIFQILSYPASRRYFGLGGYPYSVSKINQLISLFVFVVWVGLFVYPFIMLRCGAMPDWMTTEVIAWTLFAGVIVGVGVLFLCTESGIFTDHKRYMKEHTTPAFYTTFDIPVRKEKE